LFLTWSMTSSNQRLLACVTQQYSMSSTIVCSHICGILCEQALHASAILCVSEDPVITAATMLVTLYRLADY
jgi:hypothetical protein